MLRLLAMAWLVTTALGQGYGGLDFPVPRATCLDGGVEYVSEIGAVSRAECLLTVLNDVTSDDCGRACAVEPECACATHDRGECAMLSEDCCLADVLTPCRSSVVEQSRIFDYVQGGMSGTARTTRYWDCAKPACSWPNDAPVTAPVRSCRRDGLTLASPSEQSGSSGGTAFACNIQQPWVSRFDKNLGFAYVAFSVPAGGATRGCCTCFELTFADTRLAGKRLVVQVINANGPDETTPGGHFDIAVPGGGVGYFNGCKPQWDAGARWGQQYGGLGSNRDECEGLPEPLRWGCRWQYDWLLDIRSDVDYREIKCPGILTIKSGCKRLS